MPPLNQQQRGGGGERTRPISRGRIPGSSRSRSPTMNHGRRSQTPPTPAAESYALVVREHTPSPTERRRPNSNNSGRRGRGQFNNSRSPSPPSVGSSNSRTSRRSGSSSSSRGSSPTPEIWIACPKTEPFDNLSYATFDEWSLPPPTQQQSQYIPTLPPSMERPNSIGRRRDNSLERSPPSRRDNSLERLPPSRRDNSLERPPPRRLNSLERPRQRRDNSLERPWPRRDNSLERSPPRGYRRRRNSFNKDISPPVRRGDTKSFDRSPSISRQRHAMRRNSSFDRAASLQRRNPPEWSELNSHTRSKATDLSMLSQQISTSSRSNSRNRNARSVSAGRRSILDRQTERRNTEGINKANENNTVDMSNVEMALRIIEESQGKKLPRVNSSVDVNKAKSVPSSTTIMAPGPAPQRPERHSLPSKVAAGGGHKSKLRTPSPPPSRVKSPPQKGFDHEGPFHSRRRSSTSLSQHGYDSSDAPSFSNDSQPASKRGSLNDITETSVVSDRHSSNASGVRDNRVETPSYNPPPTRPSPPPIPPPPQQNVQQYPPPSSTEHIPYELPMKSNDEWRKYQVKGKRNEKQESAEQHHQYHHLGHEQPPPMQPSVGDDQSWLQYKVNDGKREKQRSSSAGRSVKSSGSRKSDVGDGDKKSSKMFGQPKRNSSERNVKSVKQMPYTDQFGDFGTYTGHVNEDGRPDGKGTMKYENGVFYEGTWTDGCQDQKAAANYERIRGGFTSWSGKGKQASKSGMVLPWNARKNDVHDDHEKTNVRGMEWTDLNGDSGRYTGEVNNDRLPHGRGIMKYSFGLIAEGEFVNGVLKENPQDRLISAAASGMSVAGMSAGPMSVGPMSTAMSVGPMSVGPMSVGPMSVGPMSV